MSPIIQKFLAQVAAMATAARASVLIVVRDPTTRIVHFVGTPGALDNMKPEIVAKVGAVDEEQEAMTGWEG